MTPISDAIVCVVPGAESSCFWEQADVLVGSKIAVAGGGSVNDMALVGYPFPTDDRSGVITTYSHKVVMGRYWVTSRYQQWNPLTRRHEEIICYRIVTPDRRVFSGRNSGFGMVLKTRRSKVLTSRLRARVGIPRESC